MSQSFLPTAPASGSDVWTVSRLNREAKSILEGAFPLLWVEGELSNFSRPRSGHWYFSLKDAAAQVRCAMFRNRNLGVRIRPVDGMRARIRCRVSLYEGRGEFQLIVEHMEEAGDGALRRGFEETKARLAAEGLFDGARKTSIPAMPRAVGVMTSTSGAAVHDVLRVLSNRFAALPVVVYPVPVQGSAAVAAMLKMLDIVAARDEVDVLLMVRGGGSLEDLAAYNEESLARAVAAFALPVVAGIGHEVDFSIVDFVADLRAATPSAAAEAVSPDGRALSRHVCSLRRRLNGRASMLLRMNTERFRQDLTRLRRQHPTRVLENQWQCLDQWERSLNRLTHRGLDERRARLRFALRRLLNQHPARRIQGLRERLNPLGARLEQAGPRRRIRGHQERIQIWFARLHRAQWARITNRSQRLSALGRQLDAVSPLAVLGRGYAIVTGPSGTVVERATDVEVGDLLDVRLKEGGVVAKVEGKGDE